MFFFFLSRLEVNTYIKYHSFSKNVLAFLFFPFFFFFYLVTIMEAKF